MECDEAGTLDTQGHMSQRRGPGPHWGQWAGHPGWLSGRGDT